MPFALVQFLKLLMALRLGSTSPEEHDKEDELARLAMLQARTKLGKDFPDGEGERERERGECLTHLQLNPLTSDDTAQLHKTIAPDMTAKAAKYFMQYMGNSSTAAITHQQRCTVAMRVVLMRLWTSKVQKLALQPLYQPLPAIAKGPRQVCGRSAAPLA